MKMSKKVSPSIKTVRKAKQAHSRNGNRTRSSSKAKPFPIVGVGASAGGLEAFTELLTHLPPDTGMAFVLVQHLDPQHESALVQILARTTAMPVREVTNNLRVEPDHVYIIPPNSNLCIAGGVLKLEARRQTRTPTRSIDSFFESLADDQSERAIGVILSGTASDGTLGLEKIKAEGGITFAQDDSARYDSMPRNAVAAGCVDLILRPRDIANELARIAKHPSYVATRLPEPAAGGVEVTFATVRPQDRSRFPARGRPTAAPSPVRSEKSKRHAEIGAEGNYKSILALLGKHSGVDFSHYKPSTIQRRITRRMILNRIEAAADYIQFLRGNKKELNVLYSDCLISVTGFFRNPEAFEALKHKIFPKLLKQRGEYPIRAWVLGCSTGQEAYSISMVFAEATQDVPRPRSLQVFATDLNDALLERARQGLYTNSLVQGVSPERLRRFFVEEEGGYRVNKELRESVVFARHNLIDDPPFSRMDLISCRNLLIYLEAGLQKKIVSTFHFALKPGGFLFLGASESIGTLASLFEPTDKKHKIYSKKPTPSPLFQLPARKAPGRQAALRKKPRSFFPLAVEPRRWPKA